MSTHKQYLGANQKKAISFQQKQAKKASLKTQNNRAILESDMLALRRDINRFAGVLKTKISAKESYEMFEETRVEIEDIQESLNDLNTHVDTLTEDVNVLLTTIEEITIDKEKSIESIHEEIADLKADQENVLNREEAMRKEIAELKLALSTLLAHQSEKPNHIDIGSMRLCVIDDDDIKQRRLKVQHANFEGQFEDVNTLSTIDYRNMIAQTQKDEVNNETPTPSIGTSRFECIE